MEDVIELAERLPAVAVFVVLSVLAYLIGSMVEDLVRRSRETWSDELPWEGERPQANASLQSYTSLALLVSERVREAQAKLKGVMEDLSALPLTLIGEAQRSYGEDPPVVWHDADEDRQGQLTSALTGQTLRELGLVRFRLMGDEPVLYGDVDRTRAEAELRLAVAVPLFAIGIVLAFRTRPTWAGAARRRRGRRRRDSCVAGAGTRRESERCSGGRDVHQ